MTVFHDDRDFERNDLVKEKSKHPLLFNYVMKRVEKGIATEISDSDAEYMFPWMRCQISGIRMISPQRQLEKHCRENGLYLTHKPHVLSFVINKK